jgi:hypothetical protein
MSGRFTGSQLDERRARAALDDHEQRLRQAEDNDVLIGDGRRLIVRSPNGHFWNLTVNNAGVISATDMGTTVP